MMQRLIGEIPAENLDLAQRAFYLYQRQFLKGQVGFVYDVTNALPILSQLTKSGQRIVELLGLEDISNSELRGASSL